MANQVSICPDAFGEGQIAALLILDGVRRVARTHLPDRFTRPGAGIFEFALACVLLGGGGASLLAWRLVVHFWCSATWARAALLSAVRAPRRSEGPCRRRSGWPLLRGVFRFGSHTSALRLIRLAVLRECVCYPPNRPFRTGPTWAFRCCFSISRNPRAPLSVRSSRVPPLIYPCARSVHVRRVGPPRHHHHILHIRESGFPMRLTRKKPSPAKVAKHFVKTHTGYAVLRGNFSGSHWNLSTTLNAHGACTASDDTQGRGSQKPEPETGEENWARSGSARDSETSENKRGAPTFAPSGVGELSVSGHILESGSGGLSFVRTDSIQTFDEKRAAVSHRTDARTTDRRATSPGVIPDGHTRSVKGVTYRKMLPQRQPREPELKNPDTWPKKIAFECNKNVGLKSREFWQKVASENKMNGFRSSLNYALLAIVFLGSAEGAVFRKDDDEASTRWLFDEGRPGKWVRATMRTPPR